MRKIESDLPPGSHLGCHLLGGALVTLPTPAVKMLLRFAADFPWKTNNTTTLNSVVKPETKIIYFALFGLN